MPTWELPDAIKQLFQMWDVRMSQGMEWPSNYNQFKIDCMKSALLQRLLRNEPLLEIPPPRSFSYPWYGIVDDGYGCPTEVWCSDGHFLGADVVVIDQCAWKLLETLGDNEWILTRPNRRDCEWTNPEHFAKERWHIYPVGCRYPRPKDPNDNWFYLWYMEKLPET